MDLLRNKYVVILLACFLAILVYHFLPDSCPEGAKRAAAILVVASIFWVTEVFQLYVTSLLVIVSLTLALAIPSDMLNLEKRNYAVFLTPFADPIILLFFGGFTLAAAVKKHHLDRFLASRIISGFGDHHYSLLLGTMCATALIGFWISNTATAVIMFAIIHPFLLAKNIDEALKKRLILSIPFTASIAGTATPIASPPNAIAMGLLEQKGIELTFLQWMEICVPLVLIRLVVVALILLYFFPSKSTKIAPILDSESLSKKGRIVGIITLVVIALFISSSWIGVPESIIAIAAAAILTAAGFLDREDIKKLDWDILILMWGGLSLGLAVDKSGFGSWLLNTSYFQYHGTALVIVLSLLAFICSTIMTNTATAALFLPLALSIEGENMIILAITVTLTSSMGLMFPISSPPNAMAYSSGIIRSRDMFTPGLLVDLISLVIIFAGFWYVIPTIMAR